jgi:hydroxymethylpyrimidine pyrophosphatase-like HAD family hydrolase
MGDFNSIIVSDYDGTIKKIDDFIEFKESLLLIKELINHKIAFMISTGRLFDSMAKEINCYDIPFSYISCANGNALYDENLKTIWKSKVKSDIIDELKQYYKYILSWESRDEYGNQTTNDALEYVIELVSNDIKIRKEIIHILYHSSLFDYCTNGEDKFQIHIFNRSDKMETIELCRHLLEVKAENIFSIGDGINDLKMIRRYNGFFIKDSMTGYVEDALGEYNSIIQLIDDVQSGQAKKRSLK